MNVLGRVRAQLRGILPARLRRAVHSLRATIGSEQKILFHAPRGALRELQARARVHYREGTIDDLRRLDSDNDYDPGTIQLMTRHLAEGDRLVLGEEDGAVSFSGWICVGAIELPRARVSLPPGLVYAYKLHSRADRRGAGLMRGFYGYVARELLAPEIEAVLAAVVVGNVASEQAHQNAGFARVGRFWDVHLGKAALAITDRGVGARIGRRVVTSYG